jgi:adenylate cyclase
VDSVERRLAAIFSVDAVGYSRLMADDDVATVRTVTVYREEIRRLVEQRHGRVVDAPGDNLLAEFPSATEAVQCAVDVQWLIRARNADVPEARRMEFRIGVHLGEVLVEGERIYGDGVNVAARLEGLAEPGGIRVSGEVHGQVRNKLDLGYEDLGEQSVKNIPQPVRVYRVRTDGEAGPARTKRPPSRLWWATSLVLASTLIIGMAVAVLVQLADRFRPVADDTVLELPRGPAIAVLPFANMSGDPGQEYFADGLTEDILTGLSRFSHLRVIGRNTTFRYKGRVVDIRELGRELDARYVLEGSVRRAADEIRVTAQLVDATSDTHLWAETYDRDLTPDNLFAIQDDIHEKVVATIADAFGIIARNRLDESRARPTESLDAYECVLRAYAYTALHTATAHLEARDCLERAVDVDPDYVDALAQLAYLYREEFHHGFNPQPASLDRALRLARRAVDLDPTNQAAQLALAQTYWSRRELGAFFAAADRAVALNPNEAKAIASVALSTTYAGRWDRGSALMRKAIALNPYHPGWYYIALFHDHYRKRQYEAALHEAQKVNMPELWETYTTLAQAYAQLGRRRQAEAAVAELLKVYPDFRENAWKEFRRRNLPEQEIAHLVEGLRKAGLEVSQPPA